MNRNGDTGILLGYGSIGRRHAAALRERMSALVIVETNEAARAQAAADHPGVPVVDRLEALNGTPFGWHEAVAVIATWGPSHAALFHELADRGVRRVLCEKPMAACVRDAAGMVERSARDGSALAVHHYLRYMGLASAVRRVTDSHELGDPVALVVEGGAACGVTNGIHWLDFATELFGCGPADVASSLYAEALNPRSPELALFGGTAVWGFGDRREAVISFSNRSSLALTGRVYFRDAVAEVDGDLGMTVRRRPLAAVQRFPAVTRTGVADEVLFQGAAPGALQYLDALRLALDEVREGRTLTCPGVLGLAAVSACVGALVASREGRRVALPLHQDEPSWSEQWPIS